MLLRYLFLLLFSITLNNGYCNHAINCQNTKKHAAFTVEPDKKHSLKIVVLRGLGKDPVEVESSFNQKFNDLKKNKKVKILVIDYIKMGLDHFEKEILKIWHALHEDKNDDQKLKLLQEKENELTPKLRKILNENINKFIQQLDDTPLENVILVGHSMGGLVGSVLIEILGSRKEGQVQSLLTSMAPPVGFNCVMSVSGDGNEVTTKTVFPWLIHTEMGEKDPIWPQGVMKMQKCFSALNFLDEASLKHFTNDSHEGDHVESKHFNKLIRKAVSIALQRQNGDKNVAVSVLG